MLPPVLVGLAVLIAACGGDSTPGPTATPAWTATATPSPTPTVPPTPRPTSTPLPTVEPPPLSGRVVTRTSVVCEPGTYGLEVHLRYSSTVEGTTEDAATITRVKVYADGVLLEDSGPISSKMYARDTRFVGLPRRRHTIQIHIETWAAPQPSDLIQFAFCPPVSSNPLA